MKTAGRTIAWVINRFDTVGGGERLINEGVRYYRSIGYRVLIITWHFDAAALFTGTYEEKDIFVLKTEETPRSAIMKRAASRARSLQTLRRILRNNEVSLVFVQGEYDVALAHLALIGTGIPYRFLIFGQMFQYPHDSGKYALVFRRHLHRIVDSLPGYKATIPITPLALSAPNWLANEVISAARYRAVRGAQKTFAFSRQVQWETEMLFGVRPDIARGAFRQQLLDDRPETLNSVCAKYGVTKGKYILSLSRLDAKKRIDLVIESFLAAKIPDCTLLIGGNGPERERLAALATAAGAGARISFCGIVNEEDLLALKRDAALFISMDIGDYDISPLEAMAMGVSTLCPIEFDRGAELEACPGMVICEPNTAAVSAAMANMIAAPPAFDRKCLTFVAWESYFAQVIN
jgi:glycosyltransferase involved in cell wall biosynthesis